MPNRNKQYLVYVLSFLLVFGLLMVFESSTAYAENVLSLKFKFRFVIQQLLWILAGGLLSLFFYKLDISTIKKFSKYILLSSLPFLLLLAVQAVISDLFNISFETPFTKITYGAFRWVVFSDVIRFQPSDLAKLGVILYFPFIMEQVVKGRTKLGHLFGLFLLVVGLVAVEPDFGTASVLVFVFGAMYLVSGLPIRYLIIFAGVILILGMSLSLSSPYRRERVLTFLHPSESDTLGEGYHINQALISVGSGGIAGVGYGNSKQKFFVPEAHSDSIYAIVAEDFGFLGSTVLSLSYFLFIFFGLRSGLEKKDLYSSLVCVGVVSFIGFQAFENLFAMLNLIPLTGVTLPFVSYGGSSMVICLACAGVLLNLADG